MTTSRVLTAVVSRSLAKTGWSISTPQLRVMVLLSSRGPLNLTAVAQSLGVSPSVASRTCDQLVESRLVIRRADRDDRRSIALSLSRSGTALVERLMAYRRTMFAEIVDCMNDKDRTALTRGLDAFMQAADTLSAREEGVEDDHLLRWLT
jgi:DNA-binding MarR family transcriptional regulator